MPEISVDTPLGWVTLTEAEGAITALDWRRGGCCARTPLLTEAAAQLEAYFRKDRTSFDLPLRSKGGAFQRSVAKAMLAIPYGATREYGQIAHDLGTMPQAVGAACGSNSIAILIPCHRVVAATGLGGFSARGGVETKIALRRHEGAYGLLI